MNYQFHSLSIHKEAKEKHIDLIRLVTPTTDEERLKTILNTASGFLYYVTITGITGQNSANIQHLKKSILKIKSSTKLPIVAGFGIKNRRDKLNVVAGSFILVKKVPFRRRG